LPDRNDHGIEQAIARVIFGQSSAEFAGIYPYCGVCAWVVGLILPVYLDAYDVFLDFRAAPRELFLDNEPEKGTETAGGGKVWVGYYSLQLRQCIRCRYPVHIRRSNSKFTQTTLF